MTTDAELLERYRRDDDAVAFAELSRRYRDMVFAVARRVVGDRHDAEDVAQGCFFELARRASQVTTSVAAYLHTSAVHQGRNLLRARSRRAHREQEAGLDRVVERSSEPKELPWADIAPEVDAAIESLPDDLRAPVILFYLRGLSDREIGMELDLSATTVTRRLRVGVCRLRAALQEGRGPFAASVLTCSLQADRMQSCPSSLTASLGRMALANLNRPVVAPPRGTPPGSPFVLANARVLAAAIAIGTLTFGGVFWRLADARERRAPYDRLAEVYQPYLAGRFAQRVAMMTDDPVAFWRGAQPLFFDWCKANGADWLGDRGDYVLAAASPYLPDARALPREIDSTNSVEMPFQLELLQAMVAVRMSAEGTNDPDRLRADRRIVDAYLEAMRQARGRALPPTSPPVTSREIDRFVNAAGGLRTVVLSPNGKVAESIEPRDDLDGVRRAVADALANNPAFLGEIAGEDRARLPASIVAAGVRTRVRSIANQGLLSIVAVARADGVVRPRTLLIELHETTPAAAELSAAVRPDPRPPGRRGAEDGMRLAPATALSWADVGGRSMLVRLHGEPVDLGSAADVDLPDRWAQAIAETHRDAPNASSIVASIDPALRATLSRRADACATSLLASFERFRADARAVADGERTQAALAERLSTRFQATHADLRR